MRTFLALLLLIAILLLPYSVGEAQQNDAVDRNALEETVMQYINALNLRDYETAYDMITPQNQTFEEYVAGYAGTERIIPYFGRVGVATGSAYMTTVLPGYQTDGTVESYYGYFRLVNGANYDPAIEGYVLSSGSFELIKDGAPLHNWTIADLVAEVWNPDLEIPDEPTTLIAMSLPQTETILNYYDLINERDFETAYQQWLTTDDGLTTDYRLPYTDFVTGYEDTVAVTVYADMPQGIPENQRRPYLFSYVPVVLVAQHTDDSFVAYSGCYAIGLLNGSESGIVNGRFTLLAETVPTAETIFSALADLNCTESGMGL